MQLKALLIIVRDAVSNFNLVEYVGGLDASIKALDILRQHKECCQDWDMFNVYGRGRASKTLKGEGASDSL